MVGVGSDGWCSGGGGGDGVVKVDDGGRGVYGMVDKWKLCMAGVEKHPETKRTLTCRGSLTSGPPGPWRL